MCVCVYVISLSLLYFTISSLIIVGVNIIYLYKLSSCPYFLFYLFNLVPVCFIYFIFSCTCTFYNYSSFSSLSTSPLSLPLFYFFNRISHSKVLMRYWLKKVLRLSKMKPWKEMRTLILWIHHLGLDLIVIILMMK